MNSEFHSAIRNIYDSASDPFSWNETMDSIASATGCLASVIAVNDLARAHESFERPYEIQAQSKVFRDSEVFPSYFEEFGKQEKADMEQLIDAEAKILLPDNMMPPNFQPTEHDIKAKEFRKKHFGIDIRIAVKLDSNVRWAEFALFQLAVKHKSVPKSIASNITNIFPHIAKSVSLGRTFADLRSKYNAVLAVLEKIECGVCVARHDGSIVFANGAAKNTIEANSQLSIDRNDKLRFADQNKDAQLKVAISSVVDSAQGNSARPEFLIPSTEGSGLENPVLVEVSPVRDTRDEFNADKEYAYILIIEANPEVTVSTNYLSFAYKLSKSESHVCRLLLLGTPVSEIADVRNVGIETVKTQVKAIYFKTSTKSRLGLLRLAYSLDPPVS